MRMSEVHLDMEVEVVGAMGKVWRIGAVNNRTQQVMIFTRDTPERCGDVEFEQVANVTPAWPKELDAAVKALHAIGGLYEIVALYVEADNRGRGTA